MLRWYLYLFTLLILTVAILTVQGQRGDIEWIGLLEALILVEASSWHCERHENTTTMMIRALQNKYESI